MTYLNKLWISFTFQTCRGSFPGPSSKSRKFKERHDFMSRWKQLEQNWRHGAMVQIVGSFDGRALEWVMNPPEPQQIFSLDMKRQLLLGRRCVKFMSHLCWNGSNCGIAHTFSSAEKEHTGEDEKDWRFSQVGCETSPAPRCRLILIWKWKYRLDEKHEVPVTESLLFRMATFTFFQHALPQKWVVIYIKIDWNLLVLAGNMQFIEITWNYHTTYNKIHNYTYKSCKSQNWPFPPRKKNIIHHIIIRPKATGLGNHQFVVDLDLRGEVPPSESHRFLLQQFLERRLVSTMGCLILKKNMISWNNKKCMDLQENDVETKNIQLQHEDL